MIVSSLEDLRGIAADIRQRHEDRSFVLDEDDEPDPDPGPPRLDARERKWAAAKLVAGTDPEDPEGAPSITQTAIDRRETSEPA